MRLEIVSRDVAHRAHLAPHGSFVLDLLGTFHEDDSARADEFVEISSEIDTMLAIRAEAQQPLQNRKPSQCAGSAVRCLCCSSCRRRCI